MQRSSSVSIAAGHRFRHCSDTTARRFRTETTGSAEHELQAPLEGGGEDLAHRALLEALDERRQEALDHELLGDRRGRPRERR